MYPVEVGNLNSNNYVSFKDKEKFLKQVIVDISFNAGHIYSKNSERLDVGDSREFVGSIISWAEEFVSNWDLDDPDLDYIGAVDDFAARKIKEYLGLSEQVVKEEVK